MMYCINYEASMRAYHFFLFYRQRYGASKMHLVALAAVPSKEVILLLFLFVLSKCSEVPIVCVFCVSSSPEPLTHGKL